MDTKDSTAFSVLFSHIINKETFSYSIHKKQREGMLVETQLR